MKKMLLRALGAWLVFAAPMFVAWIGFNNAVTGNGRITLLPIWGLLGGVVGLLGVLLVMQGTKEIDKE